jgi:predicted AAA+ superfamily ATPase
MYQMVRRMLKAGVPRTRLWWLRMDHPLLMELPLGELAKMAIRSTDATPEKPVFLFLDELTYADKWDLWLKTFFDDAWPVQVAGTSSSTAALRDRRLESGVGRWEEQYLAPYMFGEYLELLGIGHARLDARESLWGTLTEAISSHTDAGLLGEPRRRFLLLGGFPELLISTKDRPPDDISALLQSQRILRTDAVERAVYKDIPQAFKIDNPLALERVLYTLAGQVSGIISPQSICANLGGLSQATFERYLGYLERAFLVFTVPNYSGSEKSVQKRGRRLYFVDGAVRNAALQRGIAPLTDAPEMGLLMENLVAGHLYALSQQSQVRLYHWRDGNDEVDLVYDHPEQPIAFEVSSSHAHKRDGIRAFMERFPRFAGRCFIVHPNGVAIAPEESSDGIGALPVDLLLLASGAHAERELEKRMRGKGQDSPGLPLWGNFSNSAG